MIFLDEQYIYHNGIMVLPDYSNPRQFYYLPPPPRLVEDRETGKKLFKIIKLVGGLTDPIDEDGALHTGIVFFDCDLRLTAHEQDDLQEAVRSQLGINEDINLAPLLYKDGKVTCYVLGEQDWEDDAVETGAQSNIFVEQLAGFGIPSLYGDNRSSFSARMTQEGITALEASFAAGGVIGISVVYTLKFDALRPAFKFKVNAQWERIYHFLQETYKVDLWFFTYEDTSIVEQLEDEQLISFEEVIYEEGAKAEVRDLRKQLQKYILEQFFEPVLSVGDPSTNRVPGLVQDILRATVLVPTIGYKRVELTQEERRTLSFDVTQTTAIEQVIYPQAHLTALAPVDELPSYVQEVNTDQDLFFRQVNVEFVLGGVDFDKHKIAWVHPFIRYGEPPEEGMDKTLQTKDERMQFTTSLQSGHGYNYRTWYEVQFHQPDDTDPETVYGQELTYTSPLQVRSDRSLAINPMQHFELRTIEFELMTGFPANEYPVVTVDLRYEDTEGYVLEDSFILEGADNRRKRAFKLRMRRGTTAHTLYRLVYHRALGPLVPHNWEPVVGGHVLIKDPFPSFFTVAIRIAESPAELGWADLLLRYDNPEVVGSFQEKRVFITGQDLQDPSKMNQIWTVSTENPRQQRYVYTFTMFYQDGTMLRSPDWIESEARTLVLGRQIPIYRTVNVQPTGPSFDDTQLRDIKVTLVHREPDHEAEPFEIIFENERQLKEYSYRVHSPEHMGYEYDIRYRWRNGQVKHVQGSSPGGSLDLNIPTEVD